MSRKRVEVMCLALVFAIVAGCGSSSHVGTGTPTSVTTAPPRTVEPKPEGSWAVAAKGVHDTISWTLYQAGATDGGRCVSLELSPPPDRLGSVPAESLYLGRPADCVILPESSRFHPILSVADGVEGAPEDYSFLLGYAIPNTTRIEARTSRGVALENELAATQLADRMFLFF